jgi:hypothetical protein
MIWRERSVVTFQRCPHCLSVFGFYLASHKRPQKGGQITVNPPPSPNGPVLHAVELRAAYQKYSAAPADKNAA